GNGPSLKSDDVLNADEGAVEPAGFRFGVVNGSLVSLIFKHRGELLHLRETGEPFLRRLWALPSAGGAGEKRTGHHSKLCERAILSLPRPAHLNGGTTPRRRARQYPRVSVSRRLPV